MNYHVSHKFENLGRKIQAYSEKDQTDYQKLDDETRKFNYDNRLVFFIVEVIKKTHYFDQSIYFFKKKIVDFNQSSQANVDFYKLLEKGLIRVIFNIVFIKKLAFIDFKKYTSQEKEFLSRNSELCTKAYEINENIIDEITSVSHNHKLSLRFALEKRIIKKEKGKYFWVKYYSDILSCLSSEILNQLWISIDGDYASKFDFIIKQGQVTSIYPKDKFKFSISDQERELKNHILKLLASELDLKNSSVEVINSLTDSTMQRLEGDLCLIESYSINTDSIGNIVHDVDGC